MKILDISHLDVATIDYVSKYPGTLIYRNVTKLETRPPATKKDIPWFNDKGSIELAINFMHNKNPSIILMIAAYTLAKMFKGHIKWPNDVVLNGRKIAGMIIVNKENNLIFGSGINLNRKIFNQEISQKATSYINEHNKFWEPSKFVKQFLSNFISNIDKVSIKEIEDMQIFKGKNLNIKNKTYKFISLNEDGSANWEVNGKKETFTSLSFSLTHHYHLFKY